MLTADRQAFEESNMAENQAAKVVCQVCGAEKNEGEAWPGELLRQGLQQTIKKRYPHWSPTGYICLQDLNRLRSEYVEDLLEEDMGQITAVQQEAVNAIEQHELMSRNLNVEFEQDLTFWERLSDQVATFGGSWGFILGFGAVIILWIVINTVALLRHPFDPYPYIFLNLVLSGLAGFQAPIILMSQNRQDAKDRLRSEYDYRVNLKAEIEIQSLNEKMDLMLKQQWHRLMEIQRLQFQMMEELAGVCEKPGAGAGDVSSKQ
jgi:uncharacterized membrane protein